MSNITVDPAWRVSKILLPRTVGEAELYQFEVNKEAAAIDELRAKLSSSHRGRNAPEGSYIGLKVAGTLMMSDTPNEYEDHLDAIEDAHGRVLIHGLGLGCLLNVLIGKREVEHIDVVEKSGDVIALVGSHFAREKVTIHHADAATKRWPKGTRWDYAWHDIWATISDNNLEDVTAENGISYGRLFKRFRGRVTKQGAWAYDLALGMRDADVQLRERAAIWRMRFVDSDVPARVEMLIDATTAKLMSRDQWRDTIEHLPALRGEGTMLDQLRRMAENAAELTENDAYMMLMG